jgi:D-alanine-D-alanine ligase
VTPLRSSRSSNDLRVVVLAGGLSHEREVSVRSGRRVADALRSTGIDVVVHDVDADLVPALQDLRPDVVWPLLHGATGEDGSVREILELLDLPYVGTGPGSSRVAWNKAIAKGIVAAAGIATPDSVTLQQDLFRELGASSIMAEASTSPRLGSTTRPPTRSLQSPCRRSVSSGSDTSAGSTSSSTWTASPTSSRRTSRPG